MNHPQTIGGRPGHVTDWPGMQLAAPGAGREGVGHHPEGVGACAAGAGLVLFKTSPPQTPPTTLPQRENHPEFISFDKPSCRLKRLKRLRSSVWLSGQLHGMARRGFRPDVPWFVTLTYAQDNQWRANHIAEALDRYRKWCTRRGVECRYTWVGELTNRGRVHYHLVAWLPHGQRMTFWDKPRRVKGKKTSAFWTHGSSNTQQLRHGVAYLMKYLSKMGELHEFPDGMRLYGMGGLTKEARAIRTWQNLPQWVKNDHGVGDVQRLQRGWLDLVTGELLPPMWSRRFVPGGIEISPLREMTPKIYDHGPWSSYPRA